MQTNNHKITDYDQVLDARFGKEGTPERIQAEEAAYAFYSAQTTGSKARGPRHAAGAGKTHQHH